ncbi:DUF2330 domain-containing protein [candidate division WOR-3 bacterium]|nr:DUF2330 domain-containing protein [candidate division WOR-3 bacterium]
MKRALSIMVAAIAATAFADGGIFPPPGVSVYEPFQYAVIEHDGSTETLHLLVRVAGEASEFGWIVPLPKEPEIGEDTIDLFEEILDMSNPDYGYGFGCMGPGYGDLYDGNGERQVDIISQGSVGMLDWKTLAAQDPADLFSWLQDNGFPITDTTDTTSEQDSLRAVEIFADYVSRDWVFVVFTVDSITDSDANLQPVKFIFPSTDIVYPMKITSLNAEIDGYYDPYSEASYYDYYYHDYLELFLFVIADHRVEVDTGCGDISCTYANKITKSEYASIEKHFPAVAAISEEGKFITRIEAIFWNPEQVDADFVMVAAEKDSENYYGYTAGGPALALLPLAFVFGACAGISWVRRKRKRK